MADNFERIRKGDGKRIRTTNDKSRGNKAKRRTQTLKFQRARKAARQGR